MSISDWLARLGIRYWRTPRFWSLGVGRVQVALRTREGRLAQSDAGVLSYRCNVCGRNAQTPVTDLQRELPTCGTCGSTVRFRAMVHALSLALWGESLALPDFPVRRDICGLGLTDWPGYAERLAAKVSYTNTFLHAEPRLNIAEPHPELRETQDFILASDVFEHVPPPVEQALAHTCALLRPQGVLIVTVPTIEDGPGVEHFPELYQYKVSANESAWALENVTRDGRRERYENLRFHGGPGLALEMRQFSRASLLATLAKAGFTELRLVDEPCWAHGIVWLEGHSVPVLARRPRRGDGRPLRLRRVR